MGQFILEVTFHFAGAFAISTDSSLRRWAELKFTPRS